MNKNSFMYYPEITEADFNEKIYLKKEFRDTEVKEKKDYKNDLSKKREFLLDPHQIFLKNYCQQIVIK
jgi:ABC-type xylose transport system substrate-binding protein